MIKVNLLPQKRTKRAARGPSAPGDAGTRSFLIGVGALVAVGALVFFVFDMPKRSARSDLETKNKQLVSQIAQQKKELEGYDTLKEEEANAQAKVDAIGRLLRAKVVPANVLQELGQILHTEGPTMTEQMAELVAKNPNRKIQADWDPQHVWLTSFTDTKGDFKLEGGAQSKEDVTQLSKRLQASVYFVDVTPQSGDRVNDPDSGLSYYKFTITGKVAY